MFRYNEMEDMFGMDRMMNSMMNNMLSSDPFGSSFNMISPFNPSMNPMSRLMHSSALYPTMSFGQHMTPPESSYYCSSSVMSLSTDMTGRPQIYESSQTTRSGPYGVKETTSSLRDSHSGLQRMSIGHHINDRAHVMERSRNHYTGEEEEDNQFINIEEEEVPQFDSEFRQRMNGLGAHHRRRHNLPALANRPDGRPEMLALPAPQSTQSSPEVSPNSYHKSHRNHKMSQKKRSSDKKTKKPYKKS